MASNTLSASRPGAGLVVVTTAAASIVIASQIAGVGIVGGITTVTPAGVQTAVAVNTG